MRRRLHIAFCAAALTAGLLVTSCGDDSCNDNGSSLPLAILCIGDTQQNIAGLTVMGIGVPGDSLLVDSTSVNELHLPLRASATTTSYMFKRTISTEATVTDTVTIDYRPIEYFHSTACGAMFNFDISSARCTTHGLDSVVVLTSLVTNARIPALRIHFKQ